MTAERRAAVTLADGQRVCFVLKRSGRRTLEVAVHPDLRIEVTAPLDASLDRIRDKVAKRAGWIARQLRLFEDLRPLPVPRRYVPGETHRYLGRQYRLRVARGAEDRVWIHGALLHVTTRAPRDRARVRDLVRAWYDVRAHDLLTVRVSECISRAPAARLSMPSLVVRPMKTRWGSCTPRGRVTLNVDLVKTPLTCIDYVITHELCHIKAMNHGPEFHRLLARVMPDWAERRRRLDRQEV